jgi:predicted nucleic acid-binding protein
VAGYFFDTSGLVKRYVSESGSLWVNALVAPAARNSIFIVRITAVEVAAAITRRVRGGSLSAADGNQFLAWFRHDYDHQYRLTGVTPKLIAEAMTLAETRGLRGYDAVQLAAGLRVNAQRHARGISGVIFVSADAGLLAAAAAEGLAVEDPNSHP